jgi:hypothetical protein
LEKAVREANIQITGHIFHKSAQILAYADDVDIVATTKAALLEAFSALEKLAKKMGLKINQEKMKFMIVIPQKRERKAPALTSLKVEEYQFKQVESFIYLGTTVNTQNTIREEIKTKIMAANRSYFGLQKHLKSQLLSRTSKIQLYKTLIRPVIMYGSECWTLSQLDQQMVDGFERKVLRKIYSPVQDKGTWRSRYNDELYTLFKEPKLTTAIRLARLRWAGHVQRTGDDQMPKQLLYSKPRGERQVGSTKSTVMLGR